MSNIWILLCLILLAILYAGILAIYAGASRMMHAHSTIVGLITTLPVVFFLWLWIGYPLSFSNSLPEFLSLISLVTEPQWLMDFYPGTQVSQAFFLLFNFFFALIAVAVLVGSVLERTPFYFLATMSFFWILCVYVPVANSTLSGEGHLKQLGILDFAGGILVHISSGFSALALSVLIGKRIDFFNIRKKFSNAILSLGFFFVFIGWLGFNGGSSLEFNSQTSVVIFNTIISAMAGLGAWAMIDLLYTPHRLAVHSFGYGMIAGLVGITPGALYLNAWSSLGCGIICAIIANYMSRFMIRVMKVDDTAESFSTHGVAGLTGSILTAVLCLDSWLPKSLSRSEIIWNNLVASLIVAAYSFVMTLLLAFLLSKLMKTRVSKKVEKEGLDIHYHGESITNT